MDIVNPDNSLQVCLNLSNSPISFIRHKKLYKVKQILECWRLTGAWWDGQPERTFFRVLTDHYGIFELSFDHAKSEWKLSRVED